MRFINMLKQPKRISKMDLKALESRLATMGRERGLSLLMIFGSLAKGDMKPLSDVDIAVSKDAVIPLRERTRLLGEIQDIFGREDIDLVDLREASPLLKMCILKGGKIIYSRSRKDITRFRYNAISEYLATLHLREQFSYYLRRAVLGGT